MLSGRNKTAAYALSLGTCCIVFASYTASAQTVDYGSLEALVGQPVTMAATGTPQRAQDVAANMTIITADEIRQSGSRSIPEIIGRVPGMDILREGTTTFDVGVRGYQEAMQPRLLVLIDSRQVFQDDYSRTIWENLPVNIDDIRQIEVVKGPASALFGSNAAGGVINIITYNPLFDNNNVANVTYGTQNMLTGDATKTVKLSDNAGLKISVGGLIGNEFNTPRAQGFNTEGGVTTDPEHHYGLVSSVFKITPDLLGSVEGTYSKSAGTEAYYNGQLAGVETETYSARTKFAWDTPLGTIKSNNYINHSLIDNNEISNTLPFYSDTSNLIVSKWEDEFKLGKSNTFRISAEYQNKQFHLDVPSGGGDDTKVMENNFAESAMWLWQINDKLSWTNAVREDHMGLNLYGTLNSSSPYTLNSFDTNLDEFSANSGLVYQATDKDTFRLTYGRGVEMPSLLDYGFNSLNASMGSSPAIERSGNPGVDATIVTNYELGYDRVISQINSTAKLSVYYETNTDIIAPFPLVSTIATPVSAATRLREPMNVGDSNGLGGEIELVGKNDAGFRWDASYSYANVSDSTLVLQDFGYQESTPLSHFRFLIGYTTGSWEFDTNAQYLTSRTLYRLNTARAESFDYGSLSGRIGYKINDMWTAALTGTDLTRADTQESPYPAIQRQVFVNLTARF
jgi:iron complex outermembrane receptor protein